MDHKPVFLVPTIRFNLMKTLAKSFMLQPWHDQFYMLPVMQGFTVDEINEIKQILGSTLFEVRTEQMGGYVYEIRARAIQAYPKVETWIMLDDDMEMTHETNYFEAVAKAHEDGIGIVSCNWVRSDSVKLRARARYEDTFIYQPLVNMSGGQVMSGEVARMIVTNEPIDKFMFDDIQYALHAFINGYKNCRYLGSILIHRTLGKGGLSDSYNTRIHIMPDPNLVRVKKSSKVYKVEENNHLMPNSSDVTKWAKELHKTRRALMSIK